MTTDFFLAVLEIILALKKRNKKDLKKKRIKGRKVMLMALEKIPERA